MPHFSKVPGAGANHARKVARAQLVRDRSRVSARLEKGGRWIFHPGNNVIFSTDPVPKYNWMMNKKEKGEGGREGGRRGGWPSFFRLTGVKFILLLVTRFIYFPSAQLPSNIHFPAKRKNEERRKMRGKTLPRRGS